MIKVNNIKPIIFISYSRKDMNEKQELVEFLKILEGIDLLETWTDDDIGPGEDWERKIDEAISKTTIAIFLISVNFLNSQYIRDKEVPEFLKRWEKKEILIYPILATETPFEVVPWLSRLNIRPGNHKAIWREYGKYVKQELTIIVNELAKIILNMKKNDSHDFFEIIELLHEEIVGLQNANDISIQQIYTISIEPSFHQLNEIHDDYSQNLSKLCEYLRMHSLPPRNLLIWLRDVGIKYRSVRDNLWTIDADLRGIESLNLKKVAKPYDQFLVNYRNYIRSILEYYRCTVSWHGMSIYRNSEYTLQNVLDSVGDNESKDGSAYIQFKQFYEHTKVIDLLKELTKVCDNQLPRYWQTVCREFRMLKIHIANSG